MVGKKGWIRILEATIAIIIISGVLISIYAGKSQEESNINEMIRALQIKALKDISTNETLSRKVYTSPREVEDYIKSIFPPNLKFELKICRLEATSCKMSNQNVIKTMEKEVFVEETIISINAARRKVDPVKVRLFSWLER